LRSRKQQCYYTAFSKNVNTFFQIS
jgi:hypothetical protein